jgi:hypothetical protein
MTGLRELWAEERDVAFLQPVEVVGGPRLEDDPALLDGEAILIDIVDHAVSG